MSPKTHTPGPQVKERGYRFYSPGIGRWLSRDPIGERGGRNLSAFVRNAPLNRVDPLGLDSYTTHPFEPNGRMEVEIGEEPLRGPDREIKIGFILKPAKHCLCTLIDFRQSYFFTNLEGNETQARISEEGDEFEYDTSTLYGDPPGDYFIRSGGGRGRYVTGFYSYIQDAPGIGFRPELEFYYEAPGGLVIRRKTSMTFKTCAVCIRGQEEGFVYGCVKWVVGYPRLDQNPKITITGFNSPGG